MKQSFKISETNKKLIISAVAVIAIGVLAITVLVPALLPTKAPVKVPDFTEFTIEGVNTWMQENKLDETVVFIETEFSDTVEENKLISQSLVVDTEMKKEDQLTLIFSKGIDTEKKIVLPSFDNTWTEEKIVQWFNDNIFSDVTVEYVPNATIAKGYFISSNIEAGTTELARNAVVLLSISVGEKSVGIEVKVPDFTNKTRNDVAEWAKVNNISVTYSSKSSDTVEKGKVISQDKKAGETIVTGKDKLTITLSLGKGVQVTSLAGKTKSEIASWISKNNLKVTYISYYNNSVAVNTAISSSPSSGLVTTGSTIKVDLSAGKPSIDPSNKSLAQFKAHIDTINKNNNSSANLKISVVEQESDKASGTILSIKVNNLTITKETTVDVGSSIVVTVAKIKTIAVDNKANITEAELKTYIEGLGLSLGTKSTRYSTTIAKDKVISNDSGSKVSTDKINYIISLGAYSPTIADFNGKTETVVKAAINTANQLGAAWTTSLSYAYTSTVAKGIAFDCSITETKLTCKISNGSYITVVDKSGTTEANFLSYISGLGLTATKLPSVYSTTIPSGAVVTNQVGTSFTPGSAITYTLSKGIEPTPTPTPDNLQTVPSYRLSLLSESSYEASVATVTTAFAGFTNLKFVPIANDDPGKPNGLVESISEDPGALIPTDKEIIIKIIKK